MAQKETKERININVTHEQKIAVQDKAKESGKSLTDFILDRCLSDATIEASVDQFRHELEIQRLTDQLSKEKEMYELKIEYLQTTLNKTNTDLEDLKKQYQTTYNAMLWHSLPWYRKMGKKPLALTNNNE